MLLTYQFHLDFIAEIRRCFCHNLPWSLGSLLKKKTRKCNKTLQKNILVPYQNGAEKRYFAELLVKIMDINS